MHPRQNSGRLSGWIPWPSMPLLACVALVCPAVRSASETLTSNDVARVMAQGLTRTAAFLGASPATNGVVAVVDREGFVLGVWSLRPNPGALDVVDAITKAGTAAFLSSDENAFTSRTAGFIVAQHFPAGIGNTPPGPLVGVNFSNQSFSDINRFKDPHSFDPLVFGGGGTNGAPISGPALAALSGLAGSPGGVPLYKNRKLVGGLGVAVTGHRSIPALYDIQTTSRQRPDADEDAALAGQRGFRPQPAILGSRVFINGIRLPYVSSSTKAARTIPPLESLGIVVPPFAITDAPVVAYPAAVLGGVSGEMRAPVIADPVAGAIEGEPRLTADEVESILTRAARRAAITRAGIRLPVGRSARVFIAVVNNPGQSNVAPAVLGTFRVGEATMFSWDVAVQKARTAVFFSSNHRAMSTRAVGFLAQRLYPPGINNTVPGPYYRLQEFYSLFPYGVTNVLNGCFFSPPESILSSPDPNLPNGITIFPGGFPLYRHGVMIGAIGISGDGVDQDDLIAASGTTDFSAPPAIRSDQVNFRGTRLPYAKFPRNPDL